MREDLHQADRRSWNAATAAHNRHKDDQAAFFRDGGSTLFPEEVELLGRVQGPWSAWARELSAASGIAADFHRDDVYHWLARAREEGLVLTALREYPYMNGWKAFARMRPLPGRRWAPPEGIPATPLMFGIVARRD